MRDGSIAVIPAYNEELTIGSIVLRTREHVDGVIVVNDGSTDRTAEIARTAGAEVIDIEKNSGKASALMKGLQRAKHYSPAFVLTLDADWQHNPDEIPRVAAPVILGNADLVIGSRYLGNGRNIPTHRQLGQKVLNGFTNLGAGQKVTDSQSGFRALSRRALDNLDFESEGFSIESDMVMHFSSIGLNIFEVPTTVSYRVPNGHKRNSISHGVSVLNKIVGVVGYTRPLIVFGVPGIILFLTGLVLGFSSLFGFILFHWSWLTQTIAAAFSFTLGTVLVVSALILNSLVQLMRKERKDGHTGITITLIHRRRKKKKLDSLEHVE